MKSKLYVAPERQADLFSTFEAESLVPSSGRAGSPRRALHGAPTQLLGPLLTDMADILDGSDGYCVLRRLKPRPLMPLIRPAAVGTKIGVILDAETTGLDHTKDEVI